MQNSFRIQVINSFVNPLTGRMLKKGEELNVPLGRFWAKRCSEGDCKKIPLKVKKKEAAVIIKPAVEKAKKGSK